MFDQLARDPPPSGQVCFYREDEADGEALARCRECAMPVHPTCYGLAAPGPPGTAETAAGDSAGGEGSAGAGTLGADGTFLCRTCEHGVRQAGCDLCPLVGGALKICADGGSAPPAPPRSRRAAPRRAPASTTRCGCLGPGRFRWGLSAAAAAAAAHEGPAGTGDPLRRA
jgi:hypothetical protein